MRHLCALNLIDGQWQVAAGARQGDSINPATGLEIGWFTASGATDAQQAIGAARRAFDQGGWRRQPALRQALLLRWAERLAARADLAGLLTLENGKVLAQSRCETAAAVALVHQCAHLADSAGQPAGVVGMIVPWHAPVWLLVSALAPALAAGCTVVVKPAPQCVQVVAAVIGELAALDGLPGGVVNLVCEAGHEADMELVASPAVDVVRFTGSQEAARKIALAAGNPVKRLLLDIGRKSCCLVFPDVDMDALAPRLAAAATIAAGQHRSAVQRVLVHASRFEEARSALKRALEQVVVGAGDAAGSAMGPLIDASALVSVGVRTEQALGRCDEIVLRGRRLGGALSNGYFLSPTLVVQRDGMAPLSGQDEIFGPFVALGRFEDERDAILAADRMPFALASVWTADRPRALRVARALRWETIRINNHELMDAGVGARRANEVMLDFLTLPGNPPQLQP
jgi:acyl-CoA reductase-like NAD-dependent aldehyde dehydrogenase